MILTLKWFYLDMMKQINERRLSLAHFLVIFYFVIKVLGNHDSKIIIQIVASSLGPSDTSLNRGPSDKTVEIPVFSDHVWP